jgi:branched-chain amino acid transport system substrate-binding protein
VIKKPWVVLVAIIAVAALVPGCSGSSQSGTVKIALEGPITGAQASTGVDMLRAAQLAVDQANADGGILGKTIQLVRADDQADPDVGKQVAQRVIADGIVAVVGPYNSSVGVADLPIYLDAGVIPIHLTSDSETNGEGFTVQPKDYQIAPIEAKAIIDLYKAQRVAIVYDPSTYTAGIADQLQAALKKAGVAVVRYDRVPPGRQDYLGVVRKVAAAHPDLIYASTYFPEGGAIAKDIAQIHVTARCFMGLANQDPAFPTTAGLAAARACVSSGVPSAELFTGARQYVADYRDKSAPTRARGEPSRLTPSGSCSTPSAGPEAGTPRRSGKR